MRKIFIIATITVISVLAAAAVFADEGETGAPVTAAPSAAQAPSEPMPARAVSAPEQISQPDAAENFTRIRKETTLRTADAEYITGSVACVMPSGLMQPKSKLVIKDQDGNDIKFTVKVLAVIYDPTGNIMSIDKLQQGMKVQVHYKTIGNNSREATSVKVLQ